MDEVPARHRDEIPADAAGDGRLKTCEIDDGDKREYQIQDAAFGATVIEKPKWAERTCALIPLPDKRRAGPLRRRGCVRKPTRRLR